MKDPKQVVAGFVDAHNRHNIEELLSYLAEDSTMIDVAAPIPLNSKADVRKLFEMIFSSIPDVKFEVTGMVAEGNEIFVGLRTTGKGAGTWAGSNIAGKAGWMYTKACTFGSRTGRFRTPCSTAILPRSPSSSATRRL